VLERVAELDMSTLILALLMVAAILPPGGQLQRDLLGVITVLITYVRSLREHIIRVLDPIDPRNKNRGIDSWSEQEAYTDLGFHKEDLPILLQKLNLPDRITTDNRLSVSSEYAMCLLLYKMKYPSTWQRLQLPFGRTYDQLSRIFNCTLDLVYERHHRKVRGNLDWYADRFDIYNEAVHERIRNLPAYANPGGQVPQMFADIFAFLDGHARPIARPANPNPRQFGPNYNPNVQNAFWNRYYYCCYYYYYYYYY
jgi:hypothetical protein